MGMQRYLVSCECGNGPKLFLQAGENEQNPGRFYYRCPLRLQSCSFIWADELLQPKHARLHHMIVRCRNTFIPSNSSGSRARSSGEWHRSQPTQSEQASSTANVVVPMNPHILQPNRSDAIAILCCC